MIMIYNGKTGLKKTTYIKQGAGLHIDVITVNGWCAGGKGEGGRGKGGMSVQSMGEMGTGFCPNFLQPFLEDIDRREVVHEKEEQ